MPWYVYLARFAAGVLLVNAVPHFVQGLSGNRFPSPFARPPGVGDSSPLVNVLWGAANLAVGGWLLVGVGPDPPSGWVEWGLAGIGGLLIAMRLATHFGRVRSARAGRSGGD